MKCHVLVIYYYFLFVDHAQKSCIPFMYKCIYNIICYWSTKINEGFFFWNFFFSVCCYSKYKKTKHSKLLFKFLCVIRINFWLWSDYLFVLPVCNLKYIYCYCEKDFLETVYLHNLSFKSRSTRWWWWWPRRGYFLTFIFQFNFCILKNYESLLHCMNRRVHLLALQNFTIGKSN